MPTIPPLLALGILIACAAFLGFVGDWLRLPRVTSYLLSGVIVGPSALHLISTEELHHFEPIADLAMALVLFNLGSHFSIALVKKIRSHILPVAIGDLLVTFTVVSVGLLALGQGLAPALMLGCLAMATAPATTVLVLKELKSEGPVSESAQALVATNNLATILVFEVLMLLCVSLGDAGTAGMVGQIQKILWTFVGSVVLGASLGLLLSFAAGFLSSLQWMVVLLAMSLMGLGLCQTYPMSFMLVFLVTGFVFKNSSHDTEQDLVESEKITSLLCVAFFAIHGAALDLDQFLKLGAIGTAYIALRVVGKYAGIRLAATWSHESRQVQKWLGATMLSQAGAAIALSGVAATQLPELFGPVQTIILGSVIVFEIAGPLLIRFGVVQSSEVPIAHVARHTSLSFGDQIRAMVWQLKSSGGNDPAPSTKAEELTVASLIRSRVRGISQKAQFNEIISYIEHSHDNTFPVINQENQVVGIIRYPLLSEALFDPGVNKLVRAEDIATSVDRVAYPDESAADIFDFFQSSTDDCIPVVSRDEHRRMQGVVRRSDLRSLLIRKNKKGGSGH